MADPASPGSCRRTSSTRGRVRLTVPALDAPTADDADNIKPLSFDMSIVVIEMSGPAAKALRVVELAERRSGLGQLFHCDWHAALTLLGRLPGPKVWVVVQVVDDGGSGPSGSLGLAFTGRLRGARSVAIETS